MVEAAVKKNIMNLVIEADPAKGTGSLYLGGILAIMDPLIVQELNITAILTLLSESTQKLEGFWGDHRIIPMEDAEGYDISVQIQEGICFIDDHLLKGDNIIVHCMAGASRSPTIVIAYLMKKNLWTFDKAFAFTKEKRPRTKPNSYFVLKLKEFEKTLSLS